ncbi:hypothetical protein [Pseudoalteromonas denitrificans]|jgi:hypothetical protein|uniref:Uncharacterized protein n=1 Tax=Pseudoalteromonas denitrificans DSM 6059 TaxID=1123010 RepID=A0A1I1FWA2_9GAMM|nr:hypothetical protein [Pseudoalteromonas denitrificans]SFC01333.1 hypothetical protein SAMN02745724_00718 [Pseudoalteromonas denitrificans DSM 6059]
MKNTTDPQKKMSVIAQSLYLANLLLLPGLSFLLLLNYFIKFKSQSGLARIHLYRAMQLCIVNGVLLAIVPLIYIFVFSEKPDTAIMIMIFYFVCVHAVFVLLGMLNLSRAMAKKLPLF